MAIVTVCGAECNIAVAGSGTTAANRHWTVGSGTPAIDTSVVRYGARSFKFPCTSTAYVARTCAASRTVGYQRVYFRIDALPSAATPNTTSPDIMMCYPGATSWGTIRISNTGVLQACWNDAVVQNGPQLAVNTWYGIEVQWDVSANPNVCKWRVESPGTGWVDQTNADYVHAAQVITDMEFGFCNAAGNGARPTSGMNMYGDDIIIGEGTTLLEDYSSSTPRGGWVGRISPTSDGTHTGTGSNFLHNAAGAAITSATTDAWSLVDETDMTSQADFINQALVSTTQYVEVVFASPAESGIGAVGVTSTHHSASAAANTMSLRCRDGASETALWALVSVPTTTNHYLHKVMATPPAGGVWSREKLGTVTIRFGYSNDATPDTYLDAVAFEYEVKDLYRPTPPIYPQLLPR